MAEFGGSLSDENAEAEVSRRGMEPGMPAWTTDDDEIELEEAQPRRQSIGIADA